jgi:hypothetical protein
MASERGLEIISKIVSKHANIVERAKVFAVCLDEAVKAADFISLGEQLQDFGKEVAKYGDDLSKIDWTN